MKKYIIYQAHSRPSLYNEVIYSIYSFGLHNNYSDYHFLLYTDNPDYFSPYLQHISYTCHSLHAELVKEWMGPQHFIHRVKIKMLQDVLNQYIGFFLYVDSDTYFIQNIQKDFEKIHLGQKLMHCYEGNAGKLKMYKPLINYQVKTATKQYIINKNVPVWNAGALGFNNQAKSLLQEVLEMTDILQSYYPKHVSEQFAFSYFFQPQKTDALEHSIFHYWILKEFQKYLNFIFNHPSSHNREKLLDIVRHIDPRPDTYRKEKWRSHSGLYRAFQRWMGNDFKMKELTTEDLHQEKSISPNE